MAQISTISRVLVPQTDPSTPAAQSEEPKAASLPMNEAPIEVGIAMYDDIPARQFTAPYADVNMERLYSDRGASRKEKIRPRTKSTSEGSTMEDALDSSASADSSISYANSLANFDANASSYCCALGKLFPASHCHCHSRGGWALQTRWWIWLWCRSFVRCHSTFLLFRICLLVGSPPALSYSFLFLP